MFICCEKGEKGEIRSELFYHPRMGERRKRTDVSSIEDLSDRDPLV